MFDSNRTTAHCTPFLRFRLPEFPNMNFRQPNEDLFESSRMSFGEHLEELRKVLVRALIGVALASVIGFYFADRVIEILKQPLGTGTTVWLRSA